MELLEKKIFDGFVKRGFTLSLAESCTGGSLAALLVSVTDASKYFLGSIVAYSNFSKIKMLEVNPLTIEVYGAVSEETAVEMAKGAINSFESDFSIATTGIAGPGGGSEAKPIGTVCFAIASRTGITKSWTAHFAGSRHDVMKKAVEEALQKILNHI